MKVKVKVKVKVKSHGIKAGKKESVKTTVR